MIHEAGRELPTRRWLYAATTTAAVLVFVAIRTLGMRQFGAEDGGITACLAYMVKLGYRPYADIQTTGFPPLYLLMGGLSFKVLGVRWESLVTLAGVVAVASLVAQVWLFDEARFSRITALGLALFTQCATFLPLSGWWYNQMTSVLGVTFVAASLALTASPKHRGVQAAFVCATLLLSWGKPNVAGILFLGVGVALLLDKRTRVLGPLLLLGAALLSLLGLLAAGVDPRDVLASYLDASDRVSAGNFTIFFLGNDHDEAVRTLLLILPGFAAAIACVWSWLAAGRTLIRERAVYATIGAVSLIAGLVAMGTNNDHNLVDAPLIIVGCMVFARLVRGIGHRILSRGLITVMLAFTVLSLSATGVWSSVTRSRIRSIGYGAFYEDVALSATAGPRFMANVQTGPEFHTAVAGVQDILERNPGLSSQNARVYFGPRLLVMYPEFDIAPPRGLPTWWGLYPDGDPRTAALIETFRAQDRTLLVFWGDDYSFYPNALMQVLHTDYDVYTWNSLTLHVRKGSSVTLPDSAVKAN